MGAPQLDQDHALGDGVGLYEGELGLFDDLDSVIEREQRRILHLGIGRRLPAAGLGDERAVHRIVELQARALGGEFYPRMIQVSSIARVGSE
jgi:hypothetical protein